MLHDSAYGDLQQKRNFFFLCPSFSSFIKDLTILVMCLTCAGLFVA